MVVYLQHLLLETILECLEDLLSQVMLLMVTNALELMAALHAKSYVESLQHAVVDSNRRKSALKEISATSTISKQFLLVLPVKRQRVTALSQRPPLPLKVDLVHLPLLVPASLCTPASAECPHLSTVGFAELPL